MVMQASIRRISTTGCVSTPRIPQNSSAACHRSLDTQLAAMAGVARVVLRIESIIVLYRLIVRFVLGRSALMSSGKYSNPLNNERYAMKTQVNAIRIAAVTLLLTSVHIGAALAESATARQQLITRQQEATARQQLITRQQEATARQQLITRQQEATARQQLITRQQEATARQQLITRQQEATARQQLITRQQEATARQQLITRQQEATGRQQLITRHK